MKLTMKEIKKKIKNNETIQFTIASYLKNVALNKKVYKRFVKAIAQRIKSFYPEFTTAQILDVLDRLKVLPDVSKFDDEGYFMHNGRKEYSSRFDKGEASKEFNLEWIHIVSDNNEQRIYTDFYEKINYVLYNPKKDRLVFYIDDKFKTSAAKLAETKKNKKQNLESKLEEDLQSLFD